MSQTKNKKEMFLKLPQSLFLVPQETVIRLVFGLYIPGH